MSRFVFAAAAAFAVLSASCAANASGIITFTIKGTFDTLDSSLSPNNSGPLLNTGYAMSLSVGTDADTLLRTEVDASQTPVQEVAWFFNTHSSSTLDAVPQAGWTESQSAGGVVADVTNDFLYDGSMGIVPAGTYDIIELTGWRRGGGLVVDPVACGHSFFTGGGSLFSDNAPGPCSLAGSNANVDVTLIGGSGLVSSLNGIPFGNLDLTQLLYVQTSRNGFFNGVRVGGISQDPPVTYHDGIISGPGITVSAELGTVPEPATWALMLGGFGLAGAALRRRRLTVAD